MPVSHKPCIREFTPYLVFTKQKQRLRGRPAGTPWRSVACVRSVFPACYIAVTCITVVPTTISHNPIAILRARPYLPIFIMCRRPKAELVPSPPREVGVASNPESTVTCALGAFQVCSSPVLHTSQARGRNTHSLSHSDCLCTARSMGLLKNAGHHVGGGGGQFAFFPAFSAFFSHFQG